MFSDRGICLMTRGFSDGLGRDWGSGVFKSFSYQRAQLGRIAHERRRLGGIWGNGGKQLDLQKLPFGWPREKTWVYIVWKG